MAVHPIPYPNILGLSFSGTVETVGAGVTEFKAGDRVTVARTGKAFADPRFGSFQKFALARAVTTSKIPDSVSLESAVTPIVNLGTAVSAMNIHLGLERPPLSGTPQPKDKKVLVYGGSSSVGGLAVKVATAAGYRVVTTSSPKHTDFVKSLGPEHVIDHTQSPGAIVQELKSHGPYDAIFDGIGILAVTNILYEYLGSIGGGKYNTTLPPMGGENPQPDNVERLFAPYGFALDDPANKELAQWFYKELIPKGLENGIVVPTRPQMVPGGLDQVQHALDTMMENKVSGHKLVLYPWGEPEKK